MTLGFILHCMQKLSVTWFSPLSDGRRASVSVGEEKGMRRNEQRMQDIQFMELEESDLGFDMRLMGGWTIQFVFHERLF